MTTIHTDGVTARQKGRAEKVYYNEFDRHMAAWLRQLIKAGLIPDGDVDERDIREVKSDDVKGYRQCHFFAGIGGWPYALQLAGWPDDVAIWTGSCPCQPFSNAGSKKGTADNRHLWPELRRLIEECQPATVFGEQVASTLGLAWLESVRSDLENIKRRFCASILCAYAKNAPHERPRSFWASDTASNGCERIQQCVAPQIQKNRTFKTLDAWHGTGNPFEDWQKLLAGTCIRRMDDGISSGLVVRPALRGFGNAIVPQVAAEFIAAYMDVIGIAGAA